MNMKLVQDLRKNAPERPSSAFSSLENAHLYSNKLRFSRSSGLDLERLSSFCVSPVVMLVCLALTSGCASTRSETAPSETVVPTNSTQTQEVSPDDMEEIQEVIRMGMPAIESCYSQELGVRGNKSFKGEVLVKILIGTQGRAEQIQIERSTMNAPTMHDCIEKAIRRWEFPRLATPEWLSYPFVFSPAY